MSLEEFILAFILVPSLIVATFAVFIWRFWNKSYLNLCISVLFGSIIATFASAVMGVLVIGLDSTELTFAMIALAQVIPLFVAVFLYVEGSAYIERAKLHERILILENRLRNGIHKEP